jgi:hypothetical protein
LVLEEHVLQVSKVDDEEEDSRHCVVKRVIAAPKCGPVWSVGGQM